MKEGFKPLDVVFYSRKTGKESAIMRIEELKQLTLEDCKQFLKMQRELLDRGWRVRPRRKND